MSSYHLNVTNGDSWRVTVNSKYLKRVINEFKDHKINELNIIYFVSDVRLDLSREQRLSFVILYRITVVTYTYYNWTMSMFVSEVWQICRKCWSLIIYVRINYNYYQAL